MPTPDFEQQQPLAAGAFFHSEPLPQHGAKADKEGCRGAPEPAPRPGRFEPRPPCGSGWTLKASPDIF